MNQFTLALFGEAERGRFQTAYFCENLEQLLEYFGNPPKGSIGLNLAVQALLYQRDLIYLRVKEEGFSKEDYFRGVELLKKCRSIPSISAICAPGVGDELIVERISQVCHHSEGVFITSESDFYDYLTG